MNLVEWILAEHDSLVDRFESSIKAHVSRDRWRERPDGTGSSIAYLMVHSCLHADLAVHAVLGDRAMLVDRDGLGIADGASSAGLGETEDPALTAVLDLDGLATYWTEVNDAVRACVMALDLAELDVATDASMQLDRWGSVCENDAPWLHRMWRGKPRSFFLQWEAIGHRINHVGEMIAVRNRMGLSPF